MVSVGGETMIEISEINTFMMQDIADSRKIEARKAQDYYEGLHDIRNYKLYFYNGDGELKQDTSKSNIKIPHPFFTELVDQQVQYMLSGDEPMLQSGLEPLQEKIDETFDDNFMAELFEVLTGACVKGFEYMYLYKDEAGKMQFKNADALGVIEIRAEDVSDKKAHIIYFYEEKVMSDEQYERVTRIQVWDENEVWYYRKKDEEAIVIDDEVEINPRPHVLYRKGDETELYFDDFNVIPFFRLDNNKKQISNLNPIKALIDDYDLMSCGLSNNLQDVSEGLYVVKGFQGEDLDELIQNIKTKKTIGVSEDGGGVDIKTVDIPYQARQTKLELDEKNIYRFGMGFNSAQIGDGNVTNVVIKSRYALLDLKCNKLEIKLKAFLRDMLQVFIDDVNKANNTAYRVSDIDIVFEREIMTNATDNATIKKTEAEIKALEINTLLNTASVLDQETTLKSICDVLDIDFEDIKDKLEEDPAQELNKAKAQLELVQNE
jgi:SPP1 family phage portal protein